MKYIVKSAISWTGRHWRGIFVALALILVAVATLSTQLNNLVLGQNKYETLTLESISSAPKPWHRAINAPYLVPAYIFGKLFDNPLYGARITSVILGLLAVGCFFFLIKLWFNSRIAIVGSLMLLTSSWFLQFSHQATPFILLAFSLLAVFAPLAWFLRTKKYKNLAFILFVASLGFAVYVPYLPWVVAVTLIILIIKERKSLLQLSPWVIIASSVLYFTILSPLFISFTAHPGQIKELLGIPMLWPTIGQYFSNLLNIVLMIPIHSPELAEFHLDSLPLLDLFSSAMLTLGVYYYAKRLPKRRSLIILSSLVLLVVVLAFSGDYQLWSIILLPLIFICIIAGIVELLNQWFSYFPRNPLARNIGVAIIVIAIGFTSFYHLQRYFIAWPNSPETKAVYMVKSK